MTDRMFIRLSETDPPIEWAGDWPPPAHLGVLVDEHGLPTALVDRGMLVEYNRGGYSKLEDVSDSPRLARGARYYLARPTVDLDDLLTVLVLLNESGLEPALAIIDAEGHTRVAFGPLSGDPEDREAYATASLADAAANGELDVPVPLADVPFPVQVLHTPDIPT